MSHFRMDKRTVLVIVTIAVSVILIGCGGEAKETLASQAVAATVTSQSLTATATQRPPTATHTATSTSTATLTGTPMATVTSTSTPLPTLQPTDTTRPTTTSTPAPSLLSTLLAQGYELAEVTPNFEWAAAVYHAELYAPPANAPDSTSMHLLIFKTEHGQAELLAHVEHASLTLTLPIAALGGSMWRDVNHDELPELAYCTCTGELDAESIRFFQLQVDGTLIQLPPIDDVRLGFIVVGYKLYGMAEIEWDGATYRAAIYGPPQFEGYRYNYVRIYQEARGEIVGLVEKGDLDSLWHEFVEYTLQDNEISSWQDINGDGMPELVFAANQVVTGVCEKHEISIVQIQPDGNVVDVPTGDCVWDVEDVNDDGLLELVYGTGYSSAFGCAIHTACWTSDIYAWDGQAYVEADPTLFAGYYQSRIEKAINRAETIVKGDESLDAHDLESLELIMVAYKLAGREAEGTIVLDDYTDPTRYEGRLGKERLDELHKLRAFYGLPPRKE